VDKLNSTIGAVHYDAPEPLLICDELKHFWRKVTKIMGQLNYFQTLPCHMEPMAGDVQNN
jgi:hypothetical protein